MKVGFPKYVINQIHSRVKRKIYNERQQQTMNDEEESESVLKPTISIPHNKFVRQFVRPVFTGNNFRVVHPVLNSLHSQLVNNKPPCPAPRDSRDSPGVYRVPCGGCHLSYYGETGRSVGVRIGEHQSAMRRGDNKNACYKHFATTKHNCERSEA